MGNQSHNQPGRRSEIEADKRGSGSGDHGHSHGSPTAQGNQPGKSKDAFQRGSADRESERNHVPRADKHATHEDKSKSTSRDERGPGGSNEERQS